MSTVVQSVVLAREYLAEFVDDAQPLLERHWQEISSFPDIPLNPDMGRYEQLESDGQLRIFTARLDEQLIGYAVFSVAGGIHYQDSIHAVQDVAFLDPEFRRGGLALKLLRFAEEELIGEGVQLIYHHVKLKHPALGRLLEHLGYDPCETIYVKRVM